MNANISISENELLDALREATESEQGDDGALTLREIMAATGMSERRAKEHMSRLKAAGRIEPVKVRREALDGRNALVPAYRVIATHNPANSDIKQRIAPHKKGKK